MKELSIEQKAKAYDKAIKKAKSKIKNNKDHVLYENDIVDIFPTLKESKNKEDERIVKALIQLVRDYPSMDFFIKYDIHLYEITNWLEKQKGQETNDDEDILQRFSFYSYKDEPNILYLSGLYVNSEHRNKGIGTKILKIADEVAASMKCNSILLKAEIDSNAERLYKNNGYSVFKKEGNQVWLKKQGNITKLSVEEYNKIVKGVFSNCAMSFINYLDAHKYEGKMCVSNGECEDIENAFRNAMWDRLHRYYCKYIEKQNEQKLPIEKLPSEIKTIGESLGFTTQEDCDRYNQMISDLIMSDDDKGKQRSVDKVEPKFKVGDWVMLDRPVLITRVEDMPYNTHQYWTSDGTWFGDATKAKLWTIQDAKDGDVLACKNGWTCIFKTLGNDETFSSYCFMDNTKWFCETGCECHTLEEEFVKAYNGTIYPATKEQRDTFFAKMREAGYEWDASKRELKRIEQKPTEWSEEDEDMCYKATAVINRLCAEGKEYVWSVNTLKKLFYWFKSLKDRVQPQSDWSEEDKERIEQICDDLKSGMINFYANEVVKGLHYKEIIESNIEWLKELEKRITLQPKQKWNEEDIATISRVIPIVKWAAYSDHHYPILNNEGATELVERLKSLKERYTWKPNIAQLNALSIVSKGNAPDDIEAIVSLYNDLNKLRGG